MRAGNEVQALINIAEDLQSSQFENSDSLLSQNQIQTLTNAVVVSEKIYTAMIKPFDDAVWKKCESSQ